MPQTINTVSAACIVQLPNLLRNEQKQEKVTPVQNRPFYAKTVLVGCIGSALAAIAIWVATQSTTDVTEANLLTDKVRHIRQCLFFDMNKLEDNSAIFNWVAQGVSVNVLNGCGKAPLHLAVHSCNEVAVNSLLEHKADPNFQTESGLLSPLYILSYEACQSPTVLKIAKWLLDARANPNASGGDQEVTALMNFALIKKDNEVVKLLLEKGANPNVKNIHGKDVVSLIIEDDDMDQSAKIALLTTIGNFSQQLDDNIKNLLCSYLKNLQTQLLLPEFCK